MATEKEGEGTSSRATSNITLTNMGDSFDIPKLISIPVEPNNKLYQVKVVSNSLALDIQIKKLRVTFEGWKEIILLVKSVLLWEKQWHPTALIGGSTILFTLIWIMDPTVLSIVSLLGLFITISDYFIPSLSSALFKNDKWTSDKEKQLEDVCASVVMYKTKLELACGSYNRLRTTNPKMYTFLTSVVLAVLVWIGSVFNNLFLMYLVVTGLILFPGMEHHGFCKSGSSFSKMFERIVRNAKKRLGEGSPKKLN